MRTDSLFYRLFQSLPQLLFDLIAQPAVHATRYHFMSVELKQTRFYQEVFMEGQQEGHREGLQAGEAAMILRQLQRRFGELPPVMREHVTCLRLPQLENLGEALLEFRSLLDLEQWLTLHGQQ